MVLYLILSLILTPRYNFILFNNMDLIEPTFEQPLSAQYEVQPKPEIKKPISDLKDSVKTIKKGKPSPPSNNISSHPLTISLLNQSLSNYFPQAQHFGQKSLGGAIKRMIEDITSFIQKEEMPRNAETKKIQNHLRLLRSLEMQIYRASSEDEHISILHKDILRGSENSEELKQKSQQDLIKIIHSLNTTINFQKSKIGQLQKRLAEEKQKILSKNVESVSSIKFSSKAITQKRNKQEIISMLELLSSFSNIRKHTSEKIPNKQKAPEKQDEKMEIKDHFSEQIILRNKVSASTEENSISEQSAMDNKIIQCPNAFKKEQTENEVQQVFSGRLETTGIRKEEEKINIIEEGEQSDDSSYWNQFHQGNISEEFQPRSL